jgi:hypothetical protein
MRWRTSAGDEVAATLGEPLTKDLTAQAWRTALDPHGNWIPQVLTRPTGGSARFAGTLPTPEGWSSPQNHAAARAYAARLRAVTGEAPTVVLSDDPGASARIESFAVSQERWMVAVRMVSEGVDIPRLSVGVYATSVSTPLFFAQAVGRFVRARGVARRRRCSCRASRCCSSTPRRWKPSVTTRSTGRCARTASSTPRPRWSSGEPPRVRVGGAAGAGLRALEAEATFDRVLYDGGEFGTQAAVGRPLRRTTSGYPGLLEPHQVAECFSRAGRAARVGEEPPRAARRRTGGGDGAHARVRGALRKELNGLVRRVATTAPANRTRDPRDASPRVRRPPAAQAGVDGPATADRDDPRLGHTRPPLA